MIKNAVIAQSWLGPQNDRASDHVLPLPLQVLKWPHPTQLFRILKCAGGIRMLWAQSGSGPRSILKLPTLRFKRIVASPVQRCHNPCKGWNKIFGSGDPKVTLRWYQISFSISFPPSPLKLFSHSSAWNTRRNLEWKEQKWLVYFPLHLKLTDWVVKKIILLCTQQNFPNRRSESDF